MALSACGTTTKRTTEALRPDLTNPERFVCEPSGTRPAIPAEYRIDWTKVTTIAQARGEHDAFVRQLRTREGIVAGHLIKLEGKLFLCFNNMTWQRDFYSRLPAPAQPE